MVKRVLAYSVKPLHLLRYIVDNDHAEAAAKVAFGHRTILLLTGRVPHLQLYKLVVDSDNFLAKLHTNRVLRFMVDYEAIIITSDLQVLRR